MKKSISVILNVWLKKKCVRYPNSMVLVHVVTAIVKHYWVLFLAEILQQAMKSPIGYTGYV